jgi:hypothetical protein
MKLNLDFELSPALILISVGTILIFNHKPGGQTQPLVSNREDETADHPYAESTRERERERSNQRINKLSKDRKRAEQVVREGGEGRERDRQRGQEVHRVQEVRGQEVRVQEVRGQEVRGQEVRGQEVRGQEVRGQEVRGQEVRGHEHENRGPNPASCQQPRGRNS